MMNDDLSALAYKALFFGMAIYVLCLVARRVAETLAPSLKSSSKLAGIWKELILPTMPVVIGGSAGALVKSFPYPSELTSRPMHAAYGLVCGFAAGWAYRIIKASIERRWDVKLSSLPVEANYPSPDIIHVDGEEPPVRDIVAEEAPKDV